MNRRELLTLGMGAAAVAIVPAGAADRARLQLADLEPDRMWSIYRRYNLIVVGQRDDEAGSAIAKAVVDALSRFLEGSRAILARAVDARRVGVLIGTEQQDVAIMQLGSAEALYLGKPPFDDMRDVPLRALLSLGSYVLVCRRDFLDRHAYLLAKTLAENSEVLPTSVASPQGIVPMHNGARAFFAGEEIPDA